MPIKIPQLPAIPSGTVTGQTAIPVAKTSSDPKTYKMTLNQTLTWLQANGVGAGYSGFSGFGGYSGFSGATGATGAAGANGINGATIGLVIAVDPSRVFYFRPDNTTSYGTSAVTITALTQNLTATSGNPVSFTITRYNSGGSLISTNTYSGSGAGYNTIGYTVTQFGSAQTALVSASYTSGSNIFSDTEQLLRVTDGQAGDPALVGVLTNYSVALPATPSGYVSDYSLATGQFLVYYGTTIIPPGSLTFNYTQNGVTGSLNSSTGIYQINSIPDGTASGSLGMTATYGSQTVSATFTVTKSKQGTAGTAKSLRINLNKNLFRFNNSVPTIATDSITATALLDNITPLTSSTTINWTATLYNASNSPSAFTLTSVPGSSATKVLPISAFSNNSAAVECVINASIDDISTVTYGDSQSVIRIDDGTNATFGSLTNENASINAASDGTVNVSLSALSGDFIVYEGGTDVTASASGFGLYDTINGGGSTLTFVTGAYGAVANRYKVTAIGATLNVSFILSAVYNGTTIYKTFNVAKVVAGPQGDTGAGPVYQGTYSNTATYYYIPSVRTDIVLYSGSYYKTKNAAKSGSAGWGTPGSTPADWESFGASFDSVATNLLLTQDALIGRFLNMGGNTGGANQNTAIRSYSVTPTISASKSGGTLVMTGNGFYMGFPTDHAINSGNDAVFYIGNGTGASSNYMLWDGDLLKIQGNVEIAALSGMGIYSGKTSFSSTTAGFRLGVENNGVGKFSVGDSSNYLKWDGSQLLVSGNISITGGNAATQSYVNSTVSSSNSALSASVNDINAKVWTDSKGLLVAPAGAGSPSTSGLYLGASNLGYWNGSTYKTYMDNTGNFYLNGTGTNSLLWNGTSLTINGAISAIDGNFYAGNSGATKYLKWDGSSVTVKGVETVDGIVVTSGIGMRYNQDGGVFTITGGTGNGTNYGAQIDLAGINYGGTSNGGQLVLQAGEGTNSTVIIRTNIAGTSPARYGVDRVKVETNGLVTIQRNQSLGGSYTLKAGSLHIEGNLGVGTTPADSGTGGSQGDVAINGTLTIEGGNVVGSNSYGNRTIQSGGSPTGGNNGDIYYIY